MKIYRPVQTNFLTQAFGENKACRKLRAPYNVISKMGQVCPSGFADLYKSFGMKGHNGEDWKTYYGEPLYFPVDAFGITWRAKNAKDKNGGIGIDVYSNEMIDGQYIKFRFWHLQKSIVKNEQKILFANLLGFCDSTGLSSGDHIHWSKKIVDKDGNTLNKDNGYFGAITFREDFENKFAFYVLKDRYVPIKVKEVRLSLIQTIGRLIILLRKLLKLL